jgi:hypothetical protein
MEDTTTGLFGELKKGHRPLPGSLMRASRNQGYGRQEMSAEQKRWSEGGPEC